MAVKRATIAEAVELRDFVLAETGSPEAAMVAALRLFALNRDGALERTPVRHVLDAVCTYYETELAALLANSRKAGIARARQVAMALLRSAGLSLAEAGEAVGHSKGAAECACRHIEADAELRAEAAVIAEAVAKAAGDGKRMLPVIFPAGAMK